MRNDRDLVLADIRRALGREVPDGERLAEIEARLARPTRNLVPARAQGEPAALVMRFAAMAEAAAATVVRLASWAAVPAAVADFLRGHDLAPEILTASDPLLADLAWVAAGLRTRTGLPNPHETAVVTGAVAAAAETGTVVVCSGPEHPSTLNLLPDNHIVVLPVARIRGGYEDTWDLIRSAYPEGLPRTVLWITGPSRTGDIEQTLYLGAHGPRRLHILIVEALS